MFPDNLKIPTSSGCYIFKDKKGIIIYIGKAKNLKNRVSSYFSGQKDTKTAQMVSHIFSVDFFITKTEVEALILENNLIKKHRPRYNINLKDSKSYAYIFLPDENFPRLLVARDKIKKGKYFGPFTSGQKRDAILKTLRMIFRLRTCNRLPKRACLRYHINLCSAPCIGKISKEEYDLDIRHAKDVLRGNYSKIIKILSRQMQKASGLQQYEKALRLRDAIESIRILKQKQLAQTDKDYDQDVINYIVFNGKIHIVVFKVKKGVLLDKDEYRFDKIYFDDKNNKLDKLLFLDEFIARYYSEQTVPKEIIVPQRLEHALIEFLKSSNTKIKITIPKKGGKKELLDIARLNLESSFKKDDIALDDLKQKLRLNAMPKTIECFDISTLQGTNSVASMVRFTNGRPDKKNYRRFKMRTLGIDDFAMIAEVVKRRYIRLKDENGPLPDLIVIDGGKGQLHAAIEVLKMLGLRIPTISLAKRFEEVYVPGRRVPLVLDKKSHALKLLQRIRDEAHRFAITYHRLLRKKKLSADLRDS